MPVEKLHERGVIKIGWVMAVPNSVGIKVANQNGLKLGKLVRILLHCEDYTLDVATARIVLRPNGEQQETIWSSYLYRDNVLWNFQLRKGTQPIVAVGLHCKTLSRVISKPETLFGFKLWTSAFLNYSYVWCQ